MFSQEPSRFRSLFMLGQGCDTVIFSPIDAEGQELMELLMKGFPYFDIPSRAEGLKLMVLVMKGVQAPQESCRSPG
jgi:hypothetical protein